MKARAMPFLLVLAVLIAAVAAADPPAAGAQPPRAERPTHAVGDRWVRSDGVYELLRIEKDHCVFAGGPNRQMHLRRDLALARVEKGRNWIEFDPPPKLARPQQVGTSGSHGSTWRWQDGSAGRPLRAGHVERGRVRGRQRAGRNDQGLSHGIVSLQEPYAYVEEQVTAKSRAVGGNQPPAMRGELQGVLPLAKVLAK